MEGQKIIRAHDPILDIAARCWEGKRYEAAKICYRSMRTIDDLIDERKSTGDKISEVEKRQLTAKVKDWVKMITGKILCDSGQKQLLETITRFQIPLWPWESFAKSMIYDIHHESFRTFPIFLRYAEGASVAPASIFMHLCGVVKKKGCYRAPLFDIRKAAKPGAIFCYLVHIIRDFQEDQNNNLNFFADNLLATNGLNSQMLKRIAAGSKIKPEFKNLMEKYYNLAESYQRKSRRMIDKISIYLEPRYRLSLEIIYNLYLQIFERIDIHNGRFTTEELNPSSKEIMDRINLTISNVNFKMSEFTKSLS